MAYDNIAQLIELVESYGDTINSVRDLYIANISLQMNDTMRTLTIFASVLLLLTLIAGIYGMNGFDLNKLGDLPSGFLVVLISMIIITVAIFYCLAERNGSLCRVKKLYQRVFLRMRNKPHMGPILVDNQTIRLRSPVPLSESYTT